MIKRLKPKNLIDVYNFVKNTPDNYQEFYITSGNERIFLNNTRIIEKILKNQKIYGFYKDGELKGLLLIFREKGFRPYFKLLTNDRSVSWALCRFFVWNVFEETYAKLKADNPLVAYLTKINKYTRRATIGFVNKGNRGKEVLLFRPSQPKIIFKGEKDGNSE